MLVQIGSKTNIFTQHSATWINITSLLHVVPSSLDSTLRPSPSHSFLVLYTNYQKLNNTCVNQGMAPDWYLAFTVIFLILFRTPRLYPIIPSSCSITQKSSHGTPTKKVQGGFCTTACSKAFLIADDRGCVCEYALISFFNHEYKGFCMCQNGPSCWNFLVF